MILFIFGFLDFRVFCTFSRFGSYKLQYLISKWFFSKSFYTPRSDSNRAGRVCRRKSDVVVVLCVGLELWCSTRRILYYCKQKCLDTSLKIIFIIGFLSFLYFFTLSGFYKLLVYLQFPYTLHHALSIKSRNDSFVGTPIEYHKINTVLCMVGRETMTWKQDLEVYLILAYVNNDTINNIIY